MLSVLGTVRGPNQEELLVTPKGELFKITKGAVCFAKDVTTEIGKTLESKYQHDHPLTYKPSLMPTHGEMAWVWHKLFKKHKHEVLCLYGKCRESGETLFYVPKQKVERSHVEMDEGDVDQFIDRAKVIGDIHSHPWNNLPSMSGTDERDMKENPGIHGIISSDGKIQWYGSVRGGVGKLVSWDVANHNCKKTEMVKQDGLMFKDLFKHPPPVKVKKYNFGNKKGRSRGESFRKSNSTIYTGVGETNPLRINLEEETNYQTLEELMEEMTDDRKGGIIPSENELEDNNLFRWLVCRDIDCKALERSVICKLTMAGNAAIQSQNMWVTLSDYEYEKVLRPLVSATSGVIVSSPIKVREPQATPYGDTRVRMNLVRRSL